MVDDAFPVAYGPVALKNTATPDPIAIALVISVVKLAFADADGVVYSNRSPSPVHAGVPLSVKFDPNAVHVCANNPADI